VRGYSKAMERGVAVSTSVGGPAVAYLSHFMSTMPACARVTRCRLGVGTCDELPMVALGLAARHPLADFVPQTLSSRVYEAVSMWCTSRGSTWNWWADPHVEVASL